ncbi:hypothetical protein AVEN_163951-1 [Araneus ventricosus]|uniref:Uncharacterized protein n=1 Tax=Araneus ventricosus TaxID=182803 RepID=A0A4Y2H0B4_ARAVE|nr:hypothetical protein AVEN_163951-1 [Araneus ventricosus]
MTIISVLEKKKTCALATVIMYAIQKREKKKSKVWTRKWLSRRKTLGCYENLMREQALEDSESYRRWLRIDVNSFKFLLEKIQPLIKRMDTSMRQCISAGKRPPNGSRHLRV